MNNLIIQTAFLGDLILCVPLMRQLNQIDPDHPLTVVCRKGVGDALKFANVADEIIEVDKKDAGAWKLQVDQLLAKEFYNIICPHESPRTAALVWKLKAHGEKIGFEKLWNGMAFTKRVKKPEHLPDALRQISLLAALDSGFAEEFSLVAGREDILNANETSGWVDFRGKYIPQWADLRGEKGLEVTDLKNRPARIFLAPGSVWPTKQWTIEGYTEVAAALVNDGIEVVVIGNRDEAVLGERIRSKVPEVKNFAGEWSLMKSLEQMSLARALIANDSGAIHMAALAGLPTVAIFGPTTLALGFRPWQRQAIVVQKALECRPCGKHGHKACPIQTHACMKELGSGLVLEALARLEGAVTPRRTPAH